ncbi:MAG: fimbrillin family protein [Mucinivorans sp.]
MLKTTTLTATAAVALLLTGCNQQINPVNPDTWDGNIRITSQVNSLSRSTHGLDNKIATGQTVQLYMDELSSSTAATQLYNSVLTADGNGAFTGDKQLSYPLSGNDIALYAFHTTASLATTYPTAALTHTVAADQRSNTTGYAASDLMYASRRITFAEAKASSGNVALTFEHLLSKIEVVLVQNPGMPAISSVEILGTPSSATVTPSKTSAITVATSGVATPINVDTDLTSALDAVGTDESKKVLNEAIVVPTTLADKTPFIQVKLVGGVTFSYPLAAATTFAKGMKYRYTITLKSTGMGVSYSVSSWGGSSNTTGEADVVATVAPKVGDYYMNDGTLLDKDTNPLSDAQRAACIGVVMQVGKDASDPCTYNLKDGTTPLQTFHGYVLGLKDVGTQYAWSPSDKTLIGTAVPEATYTVGFYGYRDTKLIKSKAVYSSTLFPAIHWATDGYPLIAPAVSSGWFLPSSAQFSGIAANRELLLNNIRKATNSPGYDWLNNYYWTCSEFDGSNAWVAKLYDKNIKTMLKNLTTNYVRPMLAF